MNRWCRLGEAEKIISGTDTSEVADDIAETEDGMQLIVSGWQVFIPELALRLHRGILCRWDEEEQMFMPDEDVTVVCGADAESAGYICFEADGMEGTLYDFLGGRMPKEDIENLRCVIIMPEENNEKTDR